MLLAQAPNLPLLLREPQTGESIGDVLEVGLHRAGPRFHTALCMAGA
ncbi:hypothetical protein ACWGLE_06270 [Streptomyces sp. NPDC055897]